MTKPELIQPNNGPEKGIQIFEKVLTLKELTAVPIQSGRLNTSWLLQNGDTPFWVLQRLNTIFDLEAVNLNLQLLEQAQTIAKDVPNSWQPVKYLSLPDFTEKIYYDDNGVGWRLMEFIPGKIFDSFDQVPHEEQADVAKAFGQAIAVFDQILSGIPAESVGKPLPRFHDTRYHFNYLLDILDGKEVLLSLSQNPNSLVNLNRDFKAKDADRITVLWEKIKAREGLVDCLGALDQVPVHNDTKLNNAVFRKIEGKWQCVSLIDLDTIQAGSCLDDLGDALRSAGNPAGEDPSSLESVSVDWQVVDNITAGFFEKYREYNGDQAAEELRELALLAYKKYHLELAIRFFADALVGDKYFKPSFGQPKDQNLYRAEVQMRALEKIEAGRPTPR